MKKPNGVNDVRNYIGEYLKATHGFEVSPITVRTGCIAKDYLAWARGSSRVHTICYAKHGLIYLYLSGGVRLPGNDDSLEKQRNFYDVVESPDLEVWVGESENSTDGLGATKLGGAPPLLLSKEIGIARVKLHSALSQLMAIVDQELLIAKLLNEEDEFKRVTLLSGVPLQVVKFVCAKRFLSGLDLMVKLDEIATSLKKMDVPIAVPFYSLVQEVISRCERHSKSSKLV